VLSGLLTCWYSLASPVVIGQRWLSSDVLATS
jgi:hypothetical protein